MDYELRSALFGLLVIWVLGPAVAFIVLQIEPKWWTWFVSSPEFLIPYLIAGGVLVGLLLAGFRMKPRQDRPHSADRL